MHVRLSDTAQSDLDQIHSYIAAENERAAERGIDALLSAIYQLESFPFLGHPGRVSETRELKVPRLPYFVVYWIPDEFNLEIITIIHARRQYPPA